MGLFVFLFFLFIFGGLCSGGSAANGPECHGSMHLFDLDGDGHLNAGEMYLLDSFLKDKSNDEFWE